MPTGTPLPPQISAAFASERGARDAMELIAATLGYQVRGHVRQVRDAWDEPSLCILSIHVQPEDLARVQQMLALVRGIVVPPDEDAFADRARASA